MNSKILVTGAPGNVGTEIVKGLRAAGASFRVGAWEVHVARKVLGDDIEIVPFDFLKPETYEQAFSGIERLFLVRPPALANVKRDIAPALYAARSVGIRHIVFLSLQGVERNRIVPHHKIEQLILEMGVSYTFLRASFFMQNLSTTHCAEIRDRDQIALPMGKAKTSFIDVRDIAAVAVRALTEAGFENQAYTLTGSEALDYYQVSEILSRSLKRPIRYTDPNIIEFVRQQLAHRRPLGMALVMAGLYTITRLGNANQVTDNVQRVLGRAPIPFEQFVQDYAECWQHNNTGCNS